MKNHFFIFFILFISSGSLWSQNTYDFYYDNTGNRILRKTINMNGRMAKSEKINSQDTLDKAEEFNLEQISTNIDNFNISIYPNPTKGKLQIEINGEKEIISGEVVIFDIKGRSLYSNKNTSRLYNLDISSFSDGVYIMRITLNGKLFESKIIKN